MAAQALALPVTEEAKQAWQSVRTRKARFAIWKIADGEIVLEKLGAASDTVATYLGTLTDTQCRYTVYDHEYKTKDGRTTSKILFVSWTPMNSNQNDKILYSQQRHSFKESLHGTIHHNCNNKKEIEKAIDAAEGKKAEESDEENNSDID